MLRFLLNVCALFFASSLLAQVTYPYNGVKDERSRQYAFTNATIIINADTRLANANLLIEDGKIIAVGTDIRIPKSAVRVDCTDKYIYPSFIDLYSDYGMPAPAAVGKASRQRPQMLSNKRGAYHWNEAMRPEYRADLHFNKDAKKAKELRSIGFGAVLSHYMNGISRGSSVCVALADESENVSILRQQLAHHLSFRKGKSTQDYPRSLMGVIALIRQTYYDANWYAKQENPDEVNLSLQSWNELKDKPVIFETYDKLDIFRAHKIAQEFGQQYIFKGSGNEYQRLEAIKALNRPIILPLSFPKAYDVDNPYAAQMLSYKMMKHWELAPSNPTQLISAGIPVALTTHGLKDKKAFGKQMQKAIRAGLSEQDALRALTETPARLIGMYKEIGSLEKGKWANFLITSGSLVSTDNRILENWVQGHQYVLRQKAVEGLQGTYKLMLDGQSYNMFLSGTDTKRKAYILRADSSKVGVQLKVSQQTVTLSFSDPQDSSRVLLSGAMDEQRRNWEGRGQKNGTWINWSAVKSDNAQASKSKKANQPQLKPGDVTFPFTAYGWKEKPQQQTVLFRNATIWTNEAAGILQNADLLISNGKIQAVGKDLKAPREAKIVDATGKHLSCGIIDEHSHIGISRGVNEGSQASSAEVRIGDVVDSENINFYRQLAGGVTAAQLLHGSANPIGGQSAIIKFRWGWLPEEMKVRDAPQFIKFALGENVKQTNWGDNNRTRYPQTRMGVEQIYENYFSEARDYQQKKKQGLSIRHDLELETLANILDSKCFISCHSYQQGEINMLMKVAEKYGFRVNTFTHILEGYKVADKMQEHGVAGSTFADWWAYKYEVIDAIPYNAAIMHEQGVLTGINSDDAEMGRRLNQEAAKAVKYGGVSEEEAWKMVTLNPAKMLHLDQRMGSLKGGKDADVVLWSANPLSVYAKAEQTYVDGNLLYDSNKDQELRKAIAKERQRLIDAMHAAKKRGEKTQPAAGSKERHYHCDDYHDEVGG